MGAPLVLHVEHGLEGIAASGQGSGEAGTSDADDAGDEQRDLHPVEVGGEVGRGLDGRSVLEGRPDDLREPGCAEGRERVPELRHQRGRIGLADDHGLRRRDRLGRDDGRRGDDADARPERHRGLVDGRGHRRQAARRAREYDGRADRRGGREPAPMNTSGTMNRR